MESSDEEPIPEEPRPEPFARSLKEYASEYQWIRRLGWSKDAPRSQEVIATGDTLLAEDTTGDGHRWRLIDDQPWHLTCVHLAPHSIE